MTNFELGSVPKSPDVAEAEAAEDARRLAALKRNIATRSQILVAGVLLVPQVLPESRSTQD